MTVPAEPDLTGGAPDPAAAPPEPPAPAPEAEELDLDSELTQEQFDRDYVQKLRQQAARYRTSHKEVESKYKALYDGFEDPTDLDFLADLGRRLYTDPASTAAEFEAIAKRIREATAPEQTSTPEETPDDADKPLTRADLEKIEHERAVAAATRKIQEEANSLGYKDGTREYAQLIWVANNQTKGDLLKAHEVILADLKTAQDAAIQAHLEAVRAGNAEFPPVSAPGGGAPAGSPNAGPPRTFKDASAAALERLSKLA